MCRFRGREHCQGFRQTLNLGLATAAALIDAVGGPCTMTISHDFRKQRLALEPLACETDYVTHEFVLLPFAKNLLSAGKRAFVCG
jgi:hypothetical protein